MAMFLPCIVRHVMAMLCTFIFFGSFRLNKSALRARVEKFMCIQALFIRLPSITRLEYLRESYSNERLRPYHVENTGSRPITEVKQRRARLVLGWVTAWEYRVP